MSRTTDILPGARRSVGMLRTEAVAALARVRGSMLSVSTMQANAPWVAAGQADDRNINLLGSMGSAGSLGLGLAMARPDDKVLVLDGDGSLLMQLGTLVTVGQIAPVNFYHLVFENGVYQTSGDQPVPGHRTSDLCEIARASGYVQIVRCESTDDILALNEVFALPGPAFVSLAIIGQGEVPPYGGPTPPHFAAQMAAMREHLLSGRSR
jgi:phosphonopyruvate decarboxylase